jgi:hypothetical protein
MLEQVIGRGEDQLGPLGALKVSGGRNAVFRDHEEASFGYKRRVKRVELQLPQIKYILSHMRCCVKFFVTVCEGLCRS